MTASCKRALEIDLAAYLEDPTAERWQETRAHMENCSGCRTELCAWEELRADLARRDDHPDEATLLAYADDEQALAEETLQEIGQHLQTCAECRDEVRVLGSLTLEVAEQAAHSSRADRGRWDLARLRIWLGQILWHPAFAYALVVVLLMPTLARWTPNRVAELTPAHEKAVSRVDAIERVGTRLSGAAHRVEEFRTGQRSHATELRVQDDVPAIGAVGVPSPAGLSAKGHAGASASNASGDDTRAIARFAEPPAAQVATNGRPGTSASDAPGDDTRVIARYAEPPAANAPTDGRPLESPSGVLPSDLDVSAPVAIAKAERARALGVIGGNATNVGAARSRIEAEPLPGATGELSLRQESRATVVGESVATALPETTEEAAKVIGSRAKRSATFPLAGPLSGTVDEAVTVIEFRAGRSTTLKLDARGTNVVVRYALNLVPVGAAWTERPGVIGVHAAPHVVEARIVNEAGDREIRERERGVELRPGETRSIDVRVPPGWLTPGRYRVEVRGVDSKALSDPFEIVAVPDS